MLPSSYSPASEDASKWSAVSRKAAAVEEKEKRWEGRVVFLDSKDHVILTWTNLIREAVHNKKDESEMTSNSSNLQD